MTVQSSLLEGLRLLLRRCQRRSGRLSPAVYHCSLSIEAASAVYASTSGQKSLGSSPPPPPPLLVPAWADIESTDPWCCLPTLKRAMFVCEQNRDFVITALTGYGARNGELAQRADADTLSIRELLSSITDFTQTLVQYEGREKDLFSFFHELIHCMVGHEGVYSAFLQSTQSDRVHGLLATIATTPQLSPRELQQLWNEFRVANRKLLRLVQKFEVVEETVANLCALSLVAPEVANTVFDELWQAIVRDGYGAVFAANSMRMQELDLELGLKQIDYFIEAAFAVMELHTTLLDLNVHNVVNPDSVVSTDFGLTILDDVDQYILSVAPHLEPLFDQIKAFRRTAENYPVVILWQSGSSADLEVIAISDSSISESDIREEGFWESLRQQISRAIRVSTPNGCELTCPRKRDGLPCCSKEEAMWKLWTRLPKRYQAVLKPPTCGVRA